MEPRMKFRLPVSLFTFFTSLTIFLAEGSSAWAAGAQASSQINPSSQSTAGDILCLPGIYDQAPGDCLPAGPSAYLSEMAQQGVTFPVKPLPATRPDTA